MITPVLAVVGDTAPALAGTCLSGTTPADLTGASLRLNLRQPSGTVITRTATLDDASSGAWSYAWQAGELVAGTWAVEVEVTYADATVQTFPAERPAYFKVRPQLA